MPAEDGANRTPDLVLILMTGNNDSAPGGAIHRNDLASVIGKIRSWPTLNGYPPDVAMMCGGTKDVELFSVGGGFEAYYMAVEYVTGLVRSFARCNRIALFDVGTTLGLLTDGWTPEHLTLRQVPALRAGGATAMAPYVARYLCRDFYMAIRLGEAGETLRVVLGEEPQRVGVGVAEVRQPALVWAGSQRQPGGLRGVVGNAGGEFIRYRCRVRPDCDGGA